MMDKVLWILVIGYSLVHLAAGQAGDMLRKCKGDNVIAECEDGKFLTWIDAHYVLDGSTCTNPNDYQSVVKDCEIDSLNMVRNICSGMDESCIFRVNDTLSGGDSCFDVNVVEVEYGCYKINEYDSYYDDIYICGNGRIDCGHNYKIAILSACILENEKEECDEGNQIMGLRTCGEVNITSEVQYLCDGKRRCGINRNYLDQLEFELCTDEYTFLEYKYECRENYAYLGCFVDGDSPRALPDNRIERHGSMTRELCIEHCRTKYKRYAGVQNGKQCWCGDSHDNYARYGKANEIECNKICSGNNLEICGGSWRQNIFDLNPSEPMRTQRPSTICMPTDVVCHNGGTCLEEDGEQKCNCREGFTGDDCEYAMCLARSDQISSSDMPAGRNQLSWPQTPVAIGEEKVVDSNERCPVDTVHRNSALATRTCSYNSANGGQWSEIKRQSCGQMERPGIDQLSKTPVTNDNVQQVADEMGRIVEDTNADVDIRDVQIVLHNIVNVTSPSPNVTRSLINAVSSILSKRMPADARKFANASSAIVQAFERQISYTIQKHKKFSSVKPNIAVEGVSVNETEVTGGLGFAVSQTGGGFGGGGSYDPDDEMPTEGQGAGSSIQLPTDALFENGDGDTDSPKAAKVGFIGYDDTRLFQSELFNQDVNGFELVGPILSATVLDKKVVNLKKPVVIQISPNKGNVDAMANNTKCVYWDFSKRDRIGDWSEDGCELISAQSGVITCECNHLTNFAVLVDFSGEPLSFTLDVFSKVGCAVSILGLSLTLMIFLCCKGLRLSLQRKILIQLCISMLGLYFAFMLGIDGTTSEIGCIIVAAFLHYFVVTTMLWMGVEARHMYITLVSESARVSRKFLIKASVFAWGVGLIPVAVVLAVKLIQGLNYLASSYCFILPDEGLFYGLLLPIGLVILHNLITFFLVARKLLGSRSYVEKSDLQNKESETGDGEIFQKTRGVKEISQRLLNAFSVSILLGVTWVFGFLAIEEARFAFQLLFCICNSFQGFFIFILFCFAQKDVRRLVCAKCFNVAPSQTPRTPRTPKSPNVDNLKKPVATSVTSVSGDTLYTGESYTEDNDTLASTLDGMTMTELK